MINPNLNHNFFSFSGRRRHKILAILETYKEEKEICEYEKAVIAIPIILEGKENI